MNLPHRSLRRMRSVFFAPANRPDLVTKFPRFAADLSLVDLEDGTPLAAREAARQQLPALVASLRERGFARLLGVRVNEPWADGYLADIEAVSALAVDVVVVPKVEAPDALFPLVHAIRRAEQRDPRGRTIMVGIESVQGIAGVDRICGVYPEVSSLYFGAEDLVSDLRGVRSEGSVEVLYARSRVLLQARRADMTAIDQGVADIRNDALFRRDALEGRGMGYDGKICVVPQQVVLANEAFSPAEAEVAQARRLVAACEQALARGIGTIEFEGKMVDGPLLKRARAILALAGRDATAPMASSDPGST